MRGDITANARDLAGAYGLDGAAYDALATGDARTAAKYVANVAGVRAEELLPAGAGGILSAALEGDVEGVATGSAVLAAGVGGTAACGPVCGAAASAVAAVVVGLFGKLFKKNRSRKPRNSDIIAETVRLAAADLIRESDSMLPESAAVQWLNGFFESAGLAPFPFKQQIDRVTGPRDLVQWPTESFDLEGVVEVLWIEPPMPLQGNLGREVLLEFQSARFLSEGSMRVRGNVLWEFGANEGNGETVEAPADQCFLEFQYIQEGRTITRGTELAQRRAGIGIDLDDDDDASEAPTGLDDDFMSNVGNRALLEKIAERVREEAKKPGEPGVPRELVPYPPARSDSVFGLHSASTEARLRYEAAAIAALAAFAAENESDRLIEAAQESPEALQDAITESVQRGEKAVSKGSGGSGGMVAVAALAAVGLGAVVLARR
jgi:hypothetical protein